MLAKFKLDSSVLSSLPGFSFASPDNPVFSQSKFQSELCIASSQPVLHHDDYSRDFAKGKYNLAWNSMDEMNAWLQEEEETKIIELRLKEKRVNNKDSKAWNDPLPVPDK